MGGSVIIRGETIYNGDGTFTHDDKPMSWQDADKQAGFRLDRRKAWAFVDQELCEMCRWTDTCSGCSCDCGCYGDHGNAGCEECGYTGRSRRGQWIPFKWSTPDA